MEILRISSRDLKKLEKYYLNEKIENTESDIYIYKKELIKIINNKDEILNKFYLLNKLFYIKENLDFNELVLPNKLVKILGNPAGYTMNFIKDNTNIGLYLTN